MIERGRIVSRNASLRMSGRSDEQAPLPEMPPEPMGYEVVNEHGGYQGFTMALTKADAVQSFCINLLDIQPCDDLTLRLERGELPVGWRVQRWRRT